MAINFQGKGATGGASLQEQLAKMLANLQKFAGPIYEQATKEGWGGSSTETTHDPSKTAELMQDIPSAGEALLGAAQGALAGFQTARSFTPGSQGKGRTAADIIGGTLGMLAGAGGSSSSRRGAVATTEAMRGLTEQAAKFEQGTRQKMANDAVASLSQRMGELQNPQNPKEAAMFAAEKDKLVAQTAQQLALAGVAPDKAVETSRMLAAIHDPQGRFSDSRTKAASAWAEYAAIPESEKTEADKEMLRQKLNGIVVSEAIATGKMPANMGTMIFGGSQGVPGGAPAGPMSSAPPTNPGQAPGMAPEQNGAWHPPMTAPGGAPGAPPSGAGGQPANSAYLTQEDTLGSEQTGLAIGAIEDMLNLIDTAPLPAGPMEGAAYNFYEEGLSGAQGSAIGAGLGAVAGGVASGVPSLGVGAAAGVTGGAVAGGTMGRGLEGMGEGMPPWMIPGLSGEQVEGMQQMKFLSQALSSAIAKATDPKTGVQRYEGIAWQEMLYDPTKSLEVNRAGLLTLLDQMKARDAQYSAKAARGYPGGKLPAAPKARTTTRGPGYILFN